MRGQLVRDEEFAKLYCLDNGRNSVPPSLLATALLLQTHDRTSDEEAKERADFYIRWKVSKLVQQRTFFPCCRHIPIVARTGDKICQETTGRIRSATMF